MSDHILELSTEVEPAKTFTVDGEEYKLLGFEHLDAEQEAEANAAFSRFQQLVVQLGNARNDAVAKQLAKQLRERRVRLITLMTTVPLEVAEKLPIQAQTQLFQAIQTETGAEDDAAGSV